MHMESFTEGNKHKISLFAHFCAFLINDYPRLFVGLLLSVKFCASKIQTFTFWPFADFKVHSFADICYKGHFTMHLTRLLSNYILKIIIFSGWDTTTSLPGSGHLPDDSG